MRRVGQILVAALLAPVISFSAPSPAQAAAYPGVGVATNGLVLYFDPANPSAYNGSLLRDLSGNGRDATFYKTGSWPGEETGRGKYLGFDGAGGYLDLSDNLSGFTWPGLTVTFYANFGGGANNFERIIDFGNAAQSDNIIVGRRGTEATIFAEIFQGGSSSGHCMGAANSVVLGSWDYWSITFDGSTCTIYKNNSYSGSLAYPRLPNNAVRNNAYIGKSNWADAAFEGGISDLAVYNRVLSSSELLQNYNAGTDVTAPTVSGGRHSVNENQDLATSIGFDQFGSTLSIIGGNDADKVTITSSGYVYFKVNPNYESPADYGGDRRYDFVIRVIDPSGNYTDYTTYVTVANINENATLTLPALSGNPTKGISITITVIPGGDTPIPPGKVTYLMAGKRIPGCYKKVYSGTGTSTCNWKPPAQGYREISVTYTPTNNTYAAATSKKTFLVINRATKR